ncbi:uncharacterized protein SPPG_07080 [Spizellomyces punctatus DAOM BR117]|uniref:histidine kinase n=1 Tax=Spizellomyces punctatus (strain DAOM BR117) TaxID=645134 RepID=A0A0L0H8V4_SPIPD|nr:uncharacterized protein SPPG_07080 [Spizellomyces punctatus DAOM BR117]KNC97612.1 hypothetical protein SPPG_07080 [Spizellomyces punctatus DAOM BR117]|eukprot:XP_016605652.1 hypothetical protein SPPG_07080 [Spizellomyces punctatus DAOM BR117]
MGPAPDHYTELTPRWSWQLVLLSYVVAVLGSYTTTQLVIHATGCKSRTWKLTWLGLAALTLGGCGIWSMHFVGILAMDLGIPVSYDVPLTVGSFLVTVIITFCTFAVDEVLAFLQQIPRRNLNLLFPTSDEAGYQRVTGTSGENTPVWDEEEGGVGILNPPESPRTFIERDEADSETSAIDDIPIARTNVAPFWSHRAGANYVLGRIFWKFWLSLSIPVMLKGFFLALAYAAMHYMGMFAMKMDAVIEWNPLFIVLSFLDAWLICIIAFVFMPQRVESMRQFIFSLVAAAGAAIMHYTGVYAATFYTTTPPPYNKGAYPLYVAFYIIGFALGTCFISYIMLANIVTQSRNRLAEMITTKRRLWKVLAEKEAAERANKVKTDFISVASHEIRTPLHAISGYTELLEQTNLTEEQRSYVEAIKTGCHTIQLITTNVLDFTKLERGNAETRAKPVELDIRLVAANIVKSCAPSPQQTNVDLILVVEDEVPQQIFIDEIYITRVLMNLVSNAIKFTNEGYVLLALEMERNEHGDDVLLIRVKDTGVGESAFIGVFIADAYVRRLGVPPAFKNAIFEPFRQADTSHTRKHNGAGLGLAICKQLITIMQGTIEFQSTEKVGTVFSVRIPIQSPCKPDASLGAVSKYTHRGRIALLTRNRLSFDLLKTLWTNRGFCIINSPENIPEADLPEALRQADIIWTDIEIFNQKPALKDVVNTSKPLFICYQETDVDLDMASLGGNVVGVKRPIIVHLIEEWLQNPDRKLENDGMVHSVAESSTSIERTSAEYIVPVTKAKQVSSGKTKEVRFSVENGNRQIVNGAEAVARTDSGAELLAVPDSPAREKTQSQDENRESRLIHPSNVSHSKGSVLLVEDNVVNQRLGFRLLQKLGYDATLATNGLEAVQTLQANPLKFDVVLMDCQMPVMSGSEATKRIRAMERQGIVFARRTESMEGSPPRRLPIIALTANVSAESRVECETAGMDLFLPKPLKMGDLGNALERFLK